MCCPIAGSGARVLPLLARRPAHLTVVDVAAEQLWLTELRVEAVRTLDHREYLAFFGYPQGGRRLPAPPARRKALLKQIGARGRLSDEARRFAHGLLESGQWQVPLYVGRWEQTFRRISGMIRRMVGPKGLAIFNCRDLEEQRDYYLRHFPRRRFDLVLLLLGNANTFNRLLYKGHFPVHNLEVSYFQHYRRAFDHLFRTSLARQNYFLQLLFLGELVHAEGNPVECEPPVYQRIQQGIRDTQIRYVQGDAINAAQQAVARSEPIEFISFSDVPSYFSGELESRFMQQLKPALADRAQVVVRNYLRIPERLDLTGFSDETGRYADLVAAEKLQVYDIRVYRKQRSATRA